MSELMYADDTMIIGKRAREVNIMLREIEAQCEQYNLKLNRGKCKVIATNCNPDKI